MIEIRGLNKSYAINGGTLEVLKGLDADIETRGITVIVGKSGCGKTTLLRLIAGLEPPTAGSIRLPEGSRVGMVFQEARLMPWLNVERNIAFGMRGRKDMTRVRSLVELVGLTGFGRAYPAQLSGGMQQRVALARALATDSGIILMDEPFAALDYFTRRQMQKELRRIQQESGRAILMVTHNLDEALILADSLIVLSGGRVSRKFDINGLCAQRDLLSPAFIDIKRQILAEMEGE